MAQDHSFDVVSKIDLQELRNAIQQAQKEISTRFDFRGTSAGVIYEESAAIVKVAGDHEPQLRSVIDLLETRLAKRGVSLKAFAWDQSERLPSGGMKQQAKLQQGIAGEQAKAVVKAVKDLGLKVQPRIEGDAVRVVGRQLDELQAVIQVLKTKDFGIAIQVENYR